MTVALTTLMTAEAAHPHDFSLFTGGPLYRLLLRGKLVRPSMKWAWRRVAVLVAIVWLPLVVLSAVSGRLVGGVAVPLLFDVDADVKFLFALPLLIAAEPLVHRRLSEVVEELSNRGLVTPKDEPRYEKLIAWTTRLRNSTVVEVALFAVALGGYSVWRAGPSLNVANWYTTSQGAAGFTPAGYWYVFVSLPIARFILLRWYFRILVWYLFLWRVSRLKVKLDPLHPDRAGGLGFLGQTLEAMAPMLVVQSAFSAGVIGNHILHEGAKLPDFKFDIAGLIFFLLLQPVLPLMFFFLQMVKAKRATNFELGRLATRYSRDFREKWLSGHSPSDEALLGTADIQSLANLANSYGVVHSMRPVPFEPRQLLLLAVIVAIPLFPLALATVPLDELVRGIVKLLM